MFNSQRDSMTAKELADLKENLTIDLKSLICSSQDGLTDNELKREYKQLVGQKIPFETLGFNTLYELMLSMPDLCMINKHFSGVWVYHPIFDDKTKDLGMLIKTQKDSNKKLRNKSRCAEVIRRNAYRKTYNNHNIQQFSEFIPNNVQNKVQTIPVEIQKEIELILSLSETGRLSKSEFEREYAKKNIFLFNFKSIGFSSLLDALKSIDHIVKIEDIDSAQNFNISLVTIKQSKSITEQADSNKINIGLEEEVIETLKKIIFDCGEKGIYLSELPDAYIDYSTKPINYIKLGYSNLEDFVYSKLQSFTRIDVHESHYEPKLFYEENPTSNLRDESEIENFTEIMKNKENVNSLALAELKGLINDLLENQKTEKIELEVLLREFERCYGWKLDFRDYGFDNKEDFVTEIIHREIVKIDLYNHDINKLIVICPQKKPKIQIELKTRSHSDVTTIETMKSIQLANAKSIQEYVLYNQDVDSTAVLKKLASAKTHKIIVSNVVNPSNIQIQLLENVDNLNKLMEDLEVVYCGLGASNFNMPKEYIELGHLCAAIFPNDNNYHRCRITGIYNESNTVRISYIDYGGDALVKMNEIKFLSSNFAYLPIQAVNARFAHINPPFKNKWTNSIINYLLNRVAGKTLLADVIGFNDEFVSLEIYHYSSTDPSCKISLNNRIVQDGMGQKYDESNDLEFCDFEKWRNQMEQKELQLRNENDSIKQKEIMETSKNGATQNEYHKDLNNNEYEDMSNKELKELIYTINENAKKFCQEKNAIKTKQVIFFDSINSIKYNLNLVSIDGEVYVHWSEVFLLFNSGMKENVFKEILLVLRKKLHDFVTIFEWNESNHTLFDLMRLDFKIDLEKFNESEEVLMIKYKELYVCADTIFDTEKANQTKNFLRNNRISTKAEKHEILKNENIKSFVKNNEISESLKNSLIEKENKEENDKTIVDMLTKLRLREEYINSRMDRVQDQAVRNSLDNESKEMAEEIKFLENKLSKV